MLPNFLTLDIVRWAISLVLTDEGFNIPSPLATEAVGCAEKLLEWISQSENESSANKFSSQLLTDLKSCFHASKSVRVQREMMWQNYYKLRSSNEYVDAWKNFLHEAIKVKASPIFFQFVTDKLMEKLIKDHFTLVPSVHITIPASLDYLDKNAIRYTAGSVIRSLQKKVDRSLHPLKEAIKLCLVDIEEDAGKNNHSSMATQLMLL